MASRIAFVHSKETHAGLLVAVVVANIWLIYSGPRQGDVPGLWPFCLLVIALAPLLLNLLNLATPGAGTRESAGGFRLDGARYAAIFGIAWVGMSPANAEILNQPDGWHVLCSALGMVLGLVLYQWRPEWRRAGIFLLPVVAAAFCHRATLAFSPLLFAGIFLFDEDGRWSAIPSAVVRSLPALLVSLLALRLPPAPEAPLDWKIVQGARTLTQFLVPWTSSGSPEQDAAAVAMIFIAGIAVSTALWRHTRATSFGLWWFLVVVLIVPSEPLPASIGLALAGASIVARAATLAPWQDLRLLAAGCLCFLLLGGAAVVQRNVEAFEGPSPAEQAAPQRLAPPLPVSRNPAADQLLNLSLSLYQQEKFNESIAAAQNALQLDPNFAEAYNNIAAARSALGQWDEAIAAAQQALRLRPDFILARNNLNWALEQKRLGR